jgi:osmoprotectant transport system permease protein
VTGVLAENGPDSFVWWEWVGDHGDEIWSRTVEHIQLTAIALGVGLVLSILLSLVALRFRRTYTPIAGSAGVLYAIPSLALFAFLVPITGLTVLTAEIGLVSYTLLILISNIVAGVDGVPDSVKEAADGMGYSPARRFWSVELRLAMPTIIAGIRIAGVTIIGLVTVTALIGQGGYGALINDGLSRSFTTPIVVGATLSILMAITVDLVLVGVEWVLTPWTHGRRSRG